MTTRFFVAMVCKKTAGARKASSGPAPTNAVRHKNTMHAHSPFIFIPHAAWCTGPRTPGREPFFLPFSFTNNFY